MRTNRLSISLLAGLLSVVTVLAGCTNSAANSNNDDTTTNDASASGVTNIRIVTHTNWQKPLTQAIQQFEAEHTDIHVIAEFVPYTKLQETNEIKLGAKDSDIDVVTVDEPLNSNYAVKGYLAPLDPWFDASAKRQFADSAIAAGTYNGQLTSLPMNSSGVVLYYNKDLFKTYNVPFLSDSLDDRLTWEELVPIAQKFHGEGVYGFSFDQVGRAYQILPLLQSKNAAPLDESGLRSTGYTNSATSVEALQFYYDLFHTWNVSPNIKREETQDYFTSGKIAMFLGNTASLNKIEASGINYGIAPHPYFVGGQPATPTGSLNLGISAFSEHQEQAARFVKYMTTGDGARVLLEQGGLLPALKSLQQDLLEDETYSKLPGLALRLAAEDGATSAVARPSTPGYLEWETNFNKTLEDIKNGTAPQQALDSAVSEIDRQLQKYKAVSPQS
ncbi:extracellular solute-binding protein [Paenibacillus sp. WLX1005]|uniref:sugar ABC transporter substrate-binding protein n=1 Tax=Paenibacillus sp. WLX1005 TaxID=3243766 RepID=UPI0039840195